MFLLTANNEHFSLRVRSTQGVAVSATRSFATLSLLIALPFTSPTHHDSKVIVRIVRLMIPEPQRVQHLTQVTQPRLHPRRLNFVQPPCGDDENPTLDTSQHQELPQLGS